MLLVVLTPSFIWIALLIAMWLTLSFQAYRRLSIRHPIMMLLLAIMAMLAFAGSSSAIGTSFNQIGKFPCLMGYYGMWLTTGAFTIESVLLLYLCRFWPRNEAGEMLRFRRWVSLWLVFNAIAFFTFMRSIALCTV